MRAQDFAHRLGQNTLHRRRYHRADEQAVTADALVSVLGRHIVRQRVYSALGYCISGCILIAGYRGAGTDVDDGSTAPGDHDGQSVLAHQHRAACIDGHDAIPHIG